MNESLLLWFLKDSDADDYMHAKTLQLNFFILILKNGSKIIIINIQNS